ncbi:putative virion structural protein [Erwinia phage vB_EamM_Phobos]|uniref:virion structural protein n=1 Tax=Erwinia phage vB_EamM_Phobos TaxID=1883377 RepID=UPI00081C7613|nr:virion structural protein [Erwinia phage vB_EamM_Phobos]ANZ50331.1 putative virion structural protein [Erwinia phage vB_EamM_Phobos]
MPLYSKSQQQFLLDAINAVSPGAIMPADLENCTFGDPRAITAKLPEDPNTEITLRGRQGRGYIGVQTYRYRRLSLNDLFKNFIPQVTAPTAYGWLNTVAKRTAFAQNLNGRYGLNLVADDIPENYIYLNLENTLAVKATCVQYTGSIRFMSIRGKNNLEDMVLNDLLPVMNHPVDVALDKKAIGMLTYGYDFTEEPQLMKGFVNGSMSVGANFTSGYSAALMDLLSDRGLPTFDFTGAKITRKATTAEPRSNSRFDWVLVITDIQDAQVGGDCLLHYNN